MTKLLKVSCRVYFDGYLPEADEDYDGFIMEVDRYYTSKDIAEAFVFADTMMLLIRFIFITIGMTIGILMAWIGILMTGMNFDKKSRVISPAFPLPARAKVPCNHTLAYSHSASNSPVMKSNFPRNTLMSSHDPRLIIYGLTR